MKFTAAILLFAQIANADGHDAALKDLEEAMAGLGDGFDSADHAEMHPDHMMEANLDDDLEMHIND